MLQRCYSLVVLRMNRAERRNFLHKSSRYSQLPTKQPAGHHLQQSTIMELDKMLAVILFITAVSFSLPLHLHGKRCSSHKRTTVMSTIPAPQGCFDAWQFSTAFPDETEDYFAAVCKPKCREALQSFEQVCGGQTSKDHLEGLRYACAVNEYAVPCYKLAMESSGLLYSVYGNCQSRNVSECTKECKSALLNFSSTHECCANALYNSTPSPIGSELQNFVFYAADMGVMEYELWRGCDLDTPTSCWASKSAGVVSEAVAGVIVAVVMVTVSEVV